jgi:hypothetical protein
MGAPVKSVHIKKRMDAAQHPPAAVREQARDAAAM